jgi:hypothetical protein
MGRRTTSPTDPKSPKAAPSAGRLPCSHMGIRRTPCLPMMQAVIALPCPVAIHTSDPSGRCGSSLSKRGQVPHVGPEALLSTCRRSDFVVLQVPGAT